jgi:hypothetical protein
MTAAPTTAVSNTEFAFALPLYPFTVDQEGATADAISHSPGVGWVEHTVASLLQMLSSPFVECVRIVNGIWGKL